MTTLKYNDPVDGWKEITVARGPDGVKGDPATNLVTSVNGKSLTLTGNAAVVLGKGDVGLGSVDNTTDELKPLSKASRDALDLKTDLPALVTRTMSYSNGGLGGSNTPSTASTTDGSFRMSVRLPVTTTRWRIKIRHWNGVTGTGTGLPALTLKKILHGDTGFSTTSPGAEHGMFVGTPYTVFNGTQSIPSDGTWWASDWVTNSTNPLDQFDAGALHLIAISWTGTGPGTLLTGAGQCWFWNTAAASGSAIDPSALAIGATNQVSNIPLDWVIEYESTSRLKAFLFVGDSITEGIAGPQAAGAGPLAATPLWRSPPNQWGLANNVLVANASMSGRKLQDLASGSSVDGWTRFDHNGTSHLGQPAKYDGAVIALGSQDLLTGSQTVALMQGYYLSVITYLQGIIGTTKPIYFSNIMARTGTLGISSTQDTNLRIPFNTWLSQWPTGVWPAGKMAGLIDADGMTRGTITGNPLTLNPAHTTDGTHPSYTGQAALATAYKQAIVI